MNRTTHVNGNGSSAEGNGCSGDGDSGSEIEAAIDRAVGAVIGSAVGDALGAGYEGSYPHRSNEIAMRGGRGRGRRRGAWTDDPSAALGLRRGHATPGSPTGVTGRRTAVTGTDGCERMRRSSSGADCDRIAACTSLSSDSGQEEPVSQNIGLTITMLPPVVHQ